jgi:hypothetical protein
MTFAGLICAQRINAVGTYLVVETGYAVCNLTVRPGLSAVDKSRLSEAMLEAQVAAGFHRTDRFHRFLEVGDDDLLVDPASPTT